jgi:ATP-dependent Lon protease
LKHLLIPHQSRYFAWQLTRQAASDSVEPLASALVDSQVDLSPYQVEAGKITQRNLGYFEQEVQKLDAWADDLKLEVKLSHQKRQRELETKRSKQRRELFARQDAIEMQRNTLIEQLEEQLEQRVQKQVPFHVEWVLQ